MGGGARLPACLPHLCPAPACAAASGPCGAGWRTGATHCCPSPGRRRCLPRTAPSAAAGGQQVDVAALEAEMRQLAQQAQQMAAAAPDMTEEELQQVRAVGVGGVAMVGAAAAPLGCWAARAAGDRASDRLAPATRPPAHPGQPAGGAAALAAAVGQSGPGPRLCSGGGGRAAAAAAAAASGRRVMHGTRLRTRVYWRVWAASHCTNLPCLHGRAQPPLVTTWHGDERGSRRRLKALGTDGGVKGHAVA